MSIAASAERTGREAPGEGGDAPTVLFRREGSGAVRAEPTEQGGGSLRFTPIHERHALTPYYEHEGIVIYHGDCLAVIPSVSALNCDCVITDPPYPNNAGHFVDAIESAVAFLCNFKTDRWFVFWSQLVRPPVPLPLVAKHIWHRTNTNRPDNYEAIYEFADDESERASRVFPHAVVYEGLTGCSEATGHPTQKPERLMRQLISLRDVACVLDPFMGSGTTLVAAKRLGRKAIGIELEEKYCEIAAKRLQQGALPLELGA